MIGLLLRHERALRWLPGLASAALVLGVALASLAPDHPGAAGTHAAPTVQAVFLAVALLALALPYAAAGRRFEMHLPIEPRTLLRTRLLAGALVVSLPLVALSLPILATQQPAVYLNAAAGALGLALLLAHAPLAGALRRGRVPLQPWVWIGVGLASAWLLLESLTVSLDLLWRRPHGSALAGVAAWWGHCLLGVAVIHATVTWFIPGRRLAIAAGAAPTERVADHTTINGALFHGAWWSAGSHPYTVLLVALATAVLLATGVLVDQGMVLVFLVFLANLPMMGLWRQRMLRAAGWPVPRTRGLLGVLSAPLLAAAALSIGYALSPAATHLRAHVALVTYRELGDRGWASVGTPGPLARVSFGSPPKTTVAGALPIHVGSTVFPGVKLVSETPVYQGPIATVRQQLEDRLKQVMHDFTGATPDDRAIDAALAAARVGAVGMPLDQLFPGHPWRRRWADVLVLGSITGVLLLGSAAVSLRRRCHPRRRGAAELGPVLRGLTFFGLPLAIMLNDLFAIAQNRAALALLAHPWIALAPLAVLAGLAWVLYLRARGAELPRARHPQPSP